MSRSAFTQIRCLKEPTTKRYLWQPNFQENGGTTLLGFPIVLSDAMPALKPDTPSTPIAFGNFFQGYQIIDRGEFTILRDPYSVKPLVEFYVTQRLGGDVVDFEAIKLITAGE
jgi:HK97 family phage major capsid protein